MDVKMKYALNGVVSDLADVPGSEKTATLSEGYEFVFDVPQAMSHLYVTLDRPLTDGAAGQFWPAVTEAEIYIDDTPRNISYGNTCKMQKTKTRKNIGMVVIDYLQLIQGSSKRASGSREQEISEISRSLKILAKELDVPE